MPAAQLRPTFLLETELSVEEVTRRIRDSFSSQSEDDSPTGYHGRFRGDHAMISIDESKRHFWSPFMHVEIRSDETGQTVAGRFSPHPSIWTGFMFTFLAIACLMFFAAIFGVSQQLMGQSPWAYLFVPFGLVVICLLWFVSKAGQKLAHTEMEEMRSRIEDCLSN